MSRQILRAPSSLGARVRRSRRRSTCFSYPTRRCSSRSPRSARFRARRCDLESHLGPQRPPPVWLPLWSHLRKPQLLLAPALPSSHRLPRSHRLHPVSPLLQRPTTTTVMARRQVQTGMAPATRRIRWRWYTRPSRCRRRLAVDCAGCSTTRKAPSPAWACSLRFTGCCTLVSSHVSTRGLPFRRSRASATLGRFGTKICWRRSSWKRCPTL
mmetsp:Transcript_71194/g.214125  ORF Transcript_71194/g.214125 Transcript_71194/m.214125 type:complete len:212 (+) Transcript_71194:849-1484(+)